MEDEVQNNLVEVGVSGVTVLFPVDGVMVEFDVAVMSGVADFCGAVFEVGAGAAVPFAEVDDFNGLGVGGRECFPEGSGEPGGLEFHFWGEMGDAGLFLNERGGAGGEKLLVGIHRLILAIIVTRGLGVEDL